MKRHPRKTTADNPKPLPTPDQIRRYLECSVDAHHLSWQAELISSEPHWVYLLGPHLRLIELEQLETAARSCYEAGGSLPACQHARSKPGNPGTRSSSAGSPARLEVVHKYVDHGISGARTRRPGLDRLMADARRGNFDVVVVWACDRLARSTRHFLEVLDELNRLNIEFLSFRENLDTGGPLGRAVVLIIPAIAELDRNLIIERVRAGMRRAKLEGRHIGRKPLDLDQQAIVRDRARGMSLGNLARTYHTSRTAIRRVLASVPKGMSHDASQTEENRQPETGA